jgi:hypothetical protein
MLEKDYSELLSRLLETCECDLAVPSEWEDRLARRGVIDAIQDDRRKHIRHRFTRRAVLEYDQTFSSITRERTLAQIVTSNVSRNGISFLHSEQLFPGERISLWLPIGLRTYVVQRCVEHSDNCFEVGASVSADVLDDSAN